MTSPLQQKIKIAGPSVVTANRVADGAVVYRTPRAGWSPDLADSAVVQDAATARALLAEAAADDLHAVGPYIAPVSLAPDGAIAPGNLRERIRRDGVTIALAAAS
jgi:hypothetical protein